MTLMLIYMDVIVAGPQLGVWSRKGAAWEVTIGNSPTPALGEQGGQNIPRNLVMLSELANYV